MLTKEEMKSKIQELEPKAEENDIDAVSEIALLYGQLKNVEKAKEYFDKWLEIEPESAEAYYNLGVMYFNELSEEIEKDEYWEDESEDNELISLCIDSFKQAISLDEEMVEAYNNLGRLYLFLEMSDEALDKFKKSLAIDEDQPEIEEILKEHFEDLDYEI